MECENKIIKQKRACRAIKAEYKNILYLLYIDYDQSASKQKKDEFRVRQSVT